MFQYVLHGMHRSPIQTRKHTKNQNLDSMASNNTSTHDTSLIDLGEGAVGGSEQEQHAPPNTADAERQQMAQQQQPSPEQLQAQPHPKPTAPTSSYVLDRVAQLVQSYGTSDNIPVTRLEELLRMATLLPQIQLPAPTQQQEQVPDQFQAQPQLQDMPQLQFQARTQPPPNQVSQQPRQAQVNLQHQNQQFFYPHLAQPNWFGIPPWALPQPPADHGAALNTQQPVVNPFENLAPHMVSARVHPPAMDKEFIDLWLLRLESWFNNMGVRSDEQQFEILKTLLDSQLLAQVYDAARFPPAEGKYLNLKSAIKTALEESKSARYQRLIHGGDLGDQKPSHRLNILKRLANDGLTMNESLLKTIWLSHLPPEAQAILAVSQDQSLQALARLADNVVEGLSSKGISAINSANHSADTSEPPFIKTLIKAIEKMASEIKGLKNIGRSRSQSRRSTKSRESSTSPGPAKRPTDVCFYHHTFGDDARNCRSSCKYFDEFSKN